MCTTLPADQDAAAFGRTLVRERLAACVTAAPKGLSVYRWEGSVEQTEEQALTIKTTAACLSRLEQRVAELHPYDVPEFLVLPVRGGSAGYLDWLRASVTPATPADS